MFEVRYKIKENGKGQWQYARDKYGIFKFETIGKFSSWKNNSRNKMKFEIDKWEKAEMIFADGEVKELEYHGI